MAWRNFIWDVGFDPNGAITKFRFVKLDPTLPETVLQCTDAGGEVAVGVAQNTVTSTQAARGNFNHPPMSVAILGYGASEVEAGAAIVKGAFVSSDSSGRAITAATGKRIYGQAMQAASVAGDRVTVRLFAGLTLAP